MIALGTTTAAKDLLLVLSPATQLANVTLELQDRTTP